MLDNSENGLITIIICTYNRSGSLKYTLESLFVQEVDESFDYEIIVVDNNSKDKTKILVESYIPRLRDRLKYVFEPNQGLSYARNRGIKEAKGGILVFTDDDCQPEKKWILKIWGKFKANEKLDGILGGFFWRSEYNKQTNPEIDNSIGGGGLNMGFRKEIFKQIGLFDINLGAGSIGCSAEDAEFIYRAKKIIKI